MNRAAKIQAAIDALPYATGGEWEIDTSRNIRTPIGTSEKHVAMVNYNHSGDSRDVSGDEHSANATLIAASKDLAEEVVRLRGLVKEAYREGHYDGGDEGSWAFGYQDSEARKEVEGPDAP